jgi:dTDP-4-dehydrorhamnose reductase
VKVMIIGAEGQVGHSLARALKPRHTVVQTIFAPGTDRESLDIRDEAAVEKSLLSHRPHYVWLAAAMTHVDGCEAKPAEARAVNVEGPRHVALACKRIGAGLGFFSSDYVFDGVSGPYAETDPVRPLSVYGRTKYEAEQVIAGILKNYLLIRTMFVFSYLPGSVNFFMQILDRVSQGQAIQAPNDQWGNPTHADNLAQACVELMEKCASGLFHLAGLTRLHKAEWAQRIVAALHGKSQVQEMTTAEFKQAAARPLASGLRVEKAQALLKKHGLWDWETALAHTLKQMPASKPPSQ